MNTIIFLHGFPFNHTSWDSQVNFFKNKLSVKAPDLRGHGHALAPPGPWMIAHFAEDIKVMMDDQKIEKASLCGLSMGGYVALHFALQYPERVQSLILCDTQGGADTNEAKDKRFAGIQQLLKEGNEKYAVDFSKNVLSEKTLKEKPEIQKQVRAMILANKPVNMAMTLSALASRKDSLPDLAKIKCPSLVIVGADDKVTSPEVNKNLADGIAGCRYEVIPDAGHLSNLEQPDAFNQILQKFLF